ncbi:hypothetical protein ACLVWQ_19475 [Streptomyces sp. CWNU-52B]|uniref:hypothetical protein n=1 Tax=unclassified Streptomyces TaxID=2593676 RepID=UPI0039C012F0
MLHDVILPGLPPPIWPAKCRGCGAKIIGHDEVLPNELEKLYAKAVAGNTTALRKHLAKYDAAVVMHDDDCRIRNLPTSVLVHHITTDEAIEWHDKIQAILNPPQPTPPFEP